VSVIDHEKIARMTIRTVAVTPPMLADFPEAFAPLVRRGVEVVLNRGAYPMDAAQLAAFVGKAEAAIVGLDEVSAAFFEQCPALRIVARNGVGLDTVDLEAAARHGVAVTVPFGANSTSVAELALGLLIALARCIVPTHIEAQGGLWRRVQGMELAGKTLGIIGLGRIGKEVAVRALAFEMRVLAHDIAPDTAFAAAHGIGLTDLDGLLAQSDVVSLHVPLTALTRQMIDARAIARMKPGALLVNTARGGVVDSVALAAALDAGQLAGAALDVHPVEGEIEPVLTGREDVVTTTHLGAYTRESLLRTTETALQSIVDLLDGREPEGLVGAWTQGSGT
jgi:phosphoglycerate dehydrogenase-like enzyme